MDKETMQSIMNGTLERQNGGYGMKNIHHRLEIMFGPTYGLIVEGKAGVGTKVTLRLPLLEN
ncbi:hypothetical protein D3C78_1563800 [compost metagenome]